MIISAALTGAVLWLLECNKVSHLHRAGSRGERFKKDFWFVMSILIFFKRESVKNPLAKFVMIAWILFILLLGSSYTASLSSILTVDELSSNIMDFKQIRNKNVAVGYQVGSIVEDYLKLRQNITHLIPLESIDDYGDALRNRTVAVIVDEIPYISLFLAGQSASNCKFAVSKKLTIEGFGFAFHNSNLSASFSVAILNLSESGQMRVLQDGWKLSNYKCPSQVQSTRLDLMDSGGLFLLLGSVVVVCIVLFCLKLCHARQVREKKRSEAIPAFREPTFQRSMKRFFSAKHYIAREELS